MIRINLLGRARPKAARQAVPLEATLQLVFLVAALVVSFGVLYYHWHSMNPEAVEVRDAHPEADGRKGPPRAAEDPSRRFRAAKEPSCSNAST